MPRYTYHPADLQPLTGATAYSMSLRGCLVSKSGSLVKHSRSLLLRTMCHFRCTAIIQKLIKKLTETALRLKQNLGSAINEGQKLSMRINSALDRTTELTEDDISHLRQVDKRLQDLEKILQQMMDGIDGKLKGFDPAGVKWDKLDDSEIILWLEFSPDAARPSYNADAWAENGMMEPLEVRVKLWSGGKRKPWGMDDGKNHSDLGGCDGSPIQHFHQCYLFHELWDHANVGTWGMLHLRSLWIEIIPHRSGNFSI